MRAWWYKPTDDFGRPMVQRGPGDFETMQKVSEAWGRLDRLGVSGKRRFLDRVTPREVAWMMACLALLSGGMIAGVYIGFPWGFLPTGGGVVAALLCGVISGAMDGNSTAERRARTEVVRMGMCAACYYTLPAREAVSGREGDGPAPEEGVRCPECDAWWRWPTDDAATR